MRSRLFWSAALLLILALRTAAAATPDGSVKQEVRKVLLRSLRAADLNRSKAWLAHRLSELGRRSGAFTFDQDEAGEGWLARVERTHGEWVVIVRHRDDDSDMPLVGFWIGARRDNVFVSEPLPAEEQDLSGPVVGKWRRHGRYLLGAGFCLATHSPNFGESEFLVYEEGAKGAALRQTKMIEYARGAMAFASGTSDDVIGKDSNADFRTLEKARGLTLTREIRWGFRGGAYHQLSVRIRHDELWAFDRLVTAVAGRQFAVVKQMLPEPSSRRWLVKQIWRCLRRGMIRITDAYDSGLALTYSLASEHTDWASPFALRFEIRNEAWIVSKIVRHPK